MMELVAPPEWFSSPERLDGERFGDVVETATTETMDEYDAVLVGEPYDRSTVSHRGTGQGPKALREALAVTSTSPGSAGRVCSVADLGTIGVSDDGDGVDDRIQGCTDHLHAADTVPVFLGGDSSLTHPNVAPLLDRASVGVVRFDSYPNLHGAPRHGTSYRKVFEAGLDSLAVLGARNVEPTLSAHNYPYRRRCTITTLSVVDSSPIEAVDRALTTRRDVDTTYVSVNLNVLSSGSGAGGTAGIANGVSPEQLCTMVHRIATHGNVAGLEVVGCAPLLEEDDRTASVGARAIAQFLAGMNDDGSTVEDGPEQSGRAQPEADDHT